MRGKSIATGLRKISTYGNTGVQLKSSGYSTLDFEFSEGNAVDVVGASGALDYNPATEELRSYVDIWKIEDGAFNVIVTCFDNDCLLQNSD